MRIMVCHRCAAPRRSRFKFGMSLMLLRVSCEIAFTFPQPTALVLMLYLHPSLAARIRKAERLQVQPRVEVTEYTDVYGNHCGRLVVPSGRAVFSNAAIVEDNGR